MKVLQKPERTKKTEVFSFEHSSLSKFLAIWLMTSLGTKIHFSWCFHYSFRNLITRESKPIETWKFVIRLMFGRWIHWRCLIFENFNISTPSTMSHPTTLIGPTPLKWPMTTSCWGENIKNYKSSFHQSF